MEHDEVVALGGLHVLGTERHESRRIDNQLRGRAGRQGDPGSSRFYLSLQDDLMRIFGGERMQNLMLRLGMEEDVPIESKMISKRIAAAQKAVEAQNFAARKHLIEYDDVMNKQRQAVYGMRRQLLEGKEQKRKGPRDHPGHRRFLYRSALPGARPSEHASISPDSSPTCCPSSASRSIRRNWPASRARRLRITSTICWNAAITEKEELIGPENMREAERMVMLNVIDNQWKDHLLSMDHLKEGIGLRGYGQKDPLIEYKKESFTLFQDMMDRIEDETIRYLFFLQVTTSGGPGGAGDGARRTGRGQFCLSRDDDDEEEEESDEEALVTASSDQRRAAQATVQDFTRNIQRKKEKEMAELQFAGGASGTVEKKQAISDKKAGRNDPCPCGSGKKYKKCCGA